jgi:hypothetical protein
VVESRAGPRHAAWIGSLVCRRPRPWAGCSGDSDASGRPPAGLPYDALYLCLSTAGCAGNGWADPGHGDDRRAGLVALRFDHFGNWSEDVTGLAWSAYLQSRAGALRETIRRRLRRAEKLPDARFDLFIEPEQMETAASAFESVYARSWKEPEPYPEFNVALMRAMARPGWLRLGVWSVGPVPVAVQLWVVRDGNAIVLKLAHDEAFKAHSPGTVLTALMLRHLLDNEHVARIDFGRGDDAYKQGWAVERRQRIGLLLVNPWRLAGIAALLRHTAGRGRDAIRAHARRWRVLRRD